MGHGERALAADPARFATTISEGFDSFLSRPCASSCSSTAPSRPSNVVQTGVPSATASLFMVPPAETTRSESATRLGRVDGVLGDHEAARATELLALLHGSRQHHGLRCPAARSSTWREEVVLEAVVERDRRAGCAPP